MPRITQLRREGRRGDRVAVELDGSLWRTLPLDVIVRARLQVGIELERVRARTVRRELRRHEALAASTSALRHRDLSTRRFARSRALALAARGYGDAAIRFDLERKGVEAEVAAEALAELEPERDRAVRVAATAGGGVRAARLLARRGFGEEAIEAAADVA